MQFVTQTLYSLLAGTPAVAENGVRPSSAAMALYKIPLPRLLILFAVMHFMVNLRWLLALFDTVYTAGYVPKQIFVISYSY